MKKPYILIVLLFISVFSNSANQFISFKRVDGSLQILNNGKVVNIIYDNSDQKGISIAINNLVEDFNRVCGVKPELLDEVKDKNCIIIGSIESKYIGVGYSRQRPTGNDIWRV